MPGLDRFDGLAIARVAYSLILAIYIAVGVMWRFVRVSRRLGRAAIGTSRGWPHWHGRVVAFALIGYGTLLFLLVIPFANTGKLAWWTLPLAVAHRDWLLAAGLPMSLFGLFFMLVAQREMGLSWRLNIDREGPGRLLRHGLFEFCRHPVYFGAGLMVLGVAIGLLSGLSLLMLAAMWTTIALQARAEESFLIEHFGEPYIDYAARVGRFLPRLSRLRRTRSAQTGSRRPH
jgi:protein-S-isoprenylcysteine O-methyltransferase Ste14